MLLEKPAFKVLRRSAALHLLIHHFHPTTLHHSVQLILTSKNHEFLLSARLTFQTVHLSFVPAGRGLP